MQHPGGLGQRAMSSRLGRLFAGGTARTLVGMGARMLPCSATTTNPHLGVRGEEVRSFFGISKISSFIAIWGLLGSLFFTFYLFLNGEYSCMTQNSD